MTYVFGRVWSKLPHERQYDLLGYFFCVMKTKWMRKVMKDACQFKLRGTQVR